MEVAIAPAQDRPQALDAWEIDLARRELRTRGTSVPIGSRALEIVRVLADAAGDVVTKDDLIARVWPGAIVEENTLQVHMSAVRKALGPDRGLLKTTYGHGYRLLGAWTIRQKKAPAGPVDDEHRPLHALRPNIPAASSELIGRNAAMHHVQDLLSAYRAVTLTGTGGIGKTSLALAAARSLSPAFRGDAWLIELAALSDPYLVPSAVASVLGLTLGDETSAESVSRAIGGRKLLLVVDNCEHLIDAAARLSETVVRLCPNASVLATSREVLRIEGEQVYRVPPLDIPVELQGEPDSVLMHSAVQLFIARTKALSANFSLSPTNLSAIAAICRRLDGIPLAIEFAAARAATLGLPQVAGRLDDRFNLLTAGRRTALPRHRTLRAALDWSYELLGEPERRLLRRLAVFPAGFALEAAIALVDDTGTDALTVEESIASLVAKSLVTLDLSSTSESRWRLLETVRAYALEKLAECGEAAEASRRHAEYFHDFFALGAPALRPAPDVGDMARRGREIDNVRAALDWAFSSTGDVRIGIALTAAYVPVWTHFALMIECRGRIERALARIGHDFNPGAPIRMQLQIALGLALIITVGPVDRSRALLVTALEAAESCDDTDAELRALWALWTLHINTGECRAAQPLAERFSRVALRTGDPAIIPVADRIMAFTLHFAGDQREARPRFERVLGFYAQPANQRHRSFLYDQYVLTRAMHARTLWLQGFVDQAADLAQASLADAQTRDDNLALCFVLAYAVCPIASMTGDRTAAEHSVNMLIEAAMKHSFTSYSTVARYLEAALMIERGEFEAGTALLRSALETGERTGLMGCYPSYFGTLAEGTAGLGRIADAVAVVEEALARTERWGERWSVAELLRLKGELLLRESSDTSSLSAERCFLEALDVARQQGALFWELRSALSLARLRATQARQEEAQQILRPIYDRFTEGFATADLRSARDMLDSP